MISIRLTKESDVDAILGFNTSGKEFLIQWSNYEYPLTKDQILKRISSNDYYVFSIEKDHVLVGTIQIFKIDYDNKRARVGCFLIHSNDRGSGIGAHAMKLVVEYAFTKLNLNTLELSVFDFNKSAIRCYEKCGFTKTGEYTISIGWIGYNMMIQKD